MGLNEDRNDIAYVLGRLFSVLESIQKEANPTITTTIHDRYFNSACATPAVIFPVLLKLKNSHMKKLERDKGGAKVYYEKEVGKLWANLTISRNAYPWNSRGSLHLATIINSRKNIKKGRTNK